MMAVREALGTIWEGLLFPALPSVLWLGVYTLIPAIRTSAGLLALSGICTVWQFWTRLPAWLIVHGITAVLLLQLHQIPTAKGLRWRRACWCMAGLTAAFVVLRLHVFDRWTGLVFAATFPGRVLDMLVYLKLLTGFWEVGSGRIKVVPLDGLWGWFMMPWAGVLLRCSEFLPQWAALTAPTGSTLDRPLLRRRLADWCGHVGVWFLVLVLGRWLEPRLAGSKLASLMWSGFVSGPIGFYALSHLIARTHQILASGCGLRLPDNYRMPIGKPNLSEFWANWNITYTNVFRDLCFYNRWGLKRANPYLNSIILFALVGLWHAQDPYWLTWGLMHGLGFATFLYWKQRHPARAQPSPAGGLRWSRVVGAVATYAFVCLCWMLPPQILKAMHWGVTKLGLPTW